MKRVTNFVNENNFSRMMMNQISGLLREANEMSNMPSNEDTSEEDTSDGGIISLGDDSDLVKNSINNIKKMMGNANIYFDALKYNKDSGEVTWGGELSGLAWSVVKNRDTQAFYIKSETPIEVSPQTTKQLNILNNYINTDWFATISDAIQSGTIEQ